MTMRKYTVTVSVSIKSPDGQDLGSDKKDVEINLDMSEFGTVTDADTHMMDELREMAGAGAFHIGNCFC